MAFVKEIRYNVQIKYKFNDLKRSQKDNIIVYGRTQEDVIKLVSANNFKVIQNMFNFARQKKKDHIHDIEIVEIKPL